MTAQSLDVRRRHAQVGEGVGELIWIQRAQHLHVGELCAAKQSTVTSTSTSGKGTRGSSSKRSSDVDQSHHGPVWHFK